MALSVVLVCGLCGLWFGGVPGFVGLFSLWCIPSFWVRFVLVWWVLVFWVWMVGFPVQFCLVRVVRCGFCRLRVFLVGFDVLAVVSALLWGWYNIVYCRIAVLDCVVVSGLQVSGLFVLYEAGRVVCVGVYIGCLISGFWDAGGCAVRCWFELCSSMLVWVVSWSVCGFFGRFGLLGLGWIVGWVVCLVLRGFRVVGVGCYFGLWGCSRRWLRHYWCRGAFGCVTVGVFGFEGGG